MIAVSKDLTKIIVYEIYHRFKARTLFHTNVYINGSGNDFNRLRRKKKTTLSEQEIMKTW